MLTPAAGFVDGPLGCSRSAAAPRCTRRAERRAASGVKSEGQAAPAVSFFVVCRDQKEVDRLWAALKADGGRPSQCGWIDDKFGLTWQIIPQAFLRLTSDPDPKKVQAVFQAMMGMVKMDIAALKRAAKGK